MNFYLMDKCLQNILHFPLDTNLSAGQHFPAFEQPGRDKSLSSGQNSDLSSGWHYLPFEQPGPGGYCHLPFEQLGPVW